MHLAASAEGEYRLLSRGDGDDLKPETSCNDDDEEVVQKWISRAKEYYGHSSYMVFEAINWSSGTVSLEWTMWTAVKPEEGSWELVPTKKVLNLAYTDDRRLTIVSLGKHFVEKFSEVGGGDVTGSSFEFLLTQEAPVVTT